MARIFWTPAQKQELAQRSFALRNDPSFTGNDLDCLRQAQRELLKPEDHREIDQMHKFPWLRDAWVEMTKALRETTDAGIVEKKLQAIDVVRDPRIERHMNAIPQLTVKDIPFNVLWDEMGKRIAEMMAGESLRMMVREEMNSMLQRRLPGLLSEEDMQTPVEQPKTEERRFKLKVAVFGLLPGQQELMKREFKDSIDFIFFDKTPSISKLKTTAAHVHHVVQMAKFSDQIKGANRIDNFMVIPGALTQLRAFLDRKVAVAPITSTHDRATAHQH